VQILANRGQEAVISHLDESFEFLLAIVLPASLGFGIVSPHLANLILGQEFRSTASEIMPIVSIAVIFQIVAINTSTSVSCCRGETCSIW